MKTATVIGINKYGHGSDLSGCVNDAHDWQKLLTSMGYNVHLLLDGDATKDRIQRSIRTTMDALAPGEVGVVTYSGHGSWVKADNDEGDNESDGRDEVLVPSDAMSDAGNLLRDDEIAVLMQNRPTGTEVFFTADACFSGTAMRMLSDCPGNPVMHRFIPPSRWFSYDEVYRINKHARVTRNRVVAVPGVVYISGCSDAQYSADASFEGRYNGAQTYYLLRSIRELSEEAGTYENIYNILRTYLPSRSYDQVPELHCEDKARGQKFLSMDTARKNKLKPAPSNLAETVFDVMVECGKWGLNGWTEAYKMRDHFFEVWPHHDYQARIEIAVADDRAARIKASREV